MKLLFLIGRFWSTTIFTAIALTVADVSETVANPANISESQLTFTIENNDQKEPVAIANKSSAQTLVGGWQREVATSDAQKLRSTVFYNPDGTWLQLTTQADGTWFAVSSGSWQLSGNRLFEQTQAGKNIAGQVKFPSNDTMLYQSEDSSSNVSGEWNRISPNSNLSANQLLGTWSIVLQDRVAGGLIDNFNEKSILKLIELNPDGTFRYKSSDARFAFNGITVTRNSGTWEYINNGYADGMLVLRDNEGREISVGSVNWSADGEFLYITRSNRDANTNTLSGGKVEKFQRSDLVVD